MRITQWLVLRCVLLMLAISNADNQLFAAEKFRVRDFPRDQNQWARWAADKTELIISGRYEGSFSTRFRLEKLQITMAPQRATTKLPDVPPGVRMSVYGCLTRSGKRLNLNVRAVTVERASRQRA